MNDSQAGRPNILMIMTDQQRWDSLGCYGANWVQTPALDRLASEGTLFEHCYTNNPICTPARNSLLTGKPLPGHGVYGLHDILPADEVLFPRRLQDLGYRTALFGKLHVCGRIVEEERRHHNDGFDIYEWCIEASISMDSPFNGYSRWLKQRDPAFHERLRREGRKVKHIPRELHFTHWAAERTIDFIRSHDGEQPFFCKMSLFDPHNPYEQHPLETESLVDVAAIPEPLPVEPGPAPEGVLRERDHSYLGARSSFDEEAIRKIRLGYYSMVAFADQEIGRVLQELEEQGIADNTMVIFCSDHGDMLGDHGLMVKGACFYDGCTRVPLMIRWPAGVATSAGVATPTGAATSSGATTPTEAASSGGRVTAPVQLHDIAATVLSAAGMSDLEIRRYMPDSVSLLPLMRDPAASAHDYVVCAYRNSGICDTGEPWDPPIHATMIRDDRYKLNVFHASPAGVEFSPGASTSQPPRTPAAEATQSRTTIPGQLFDMEDDPREQNNLWGLPEYAAVQLRLTQALVEWLHQHELTLGGRGGTSIPPADQRVVNTITP